MKKLYTKKSSINGSGLFTYKNFSKGDFVAYISGDIKVIKKFNYYLSENTINWIGVGRFSWIDTTNSLFKFVNHSCDPNTALISKRKVIAIKPIKAGDEITLDYSLTECEDEWSIPNCECGSKKCRNKITALQHLPIDIFTTKKQYIPKNLVKTYYNLHNGA